MTLLTINSVDFTSKIVEKSYKMDKKSVYTTWTDGNMKTHRVVSRTQVTGSFTMTFLTATDYTNFESAIAAVKQDGDYLPVTVYVNNTKTTETINAYLDYSTRLVWTYETTRSPEVATIQVKLTER